MPQPNGRDATQLQKYIGATPIGYSHLYYSELGDMDSELNLGLEKICGFSLDALKLAYQESIPSELELAPPTSFWKSYGDEKLAVGLRACLATWSISGKKIVPNEFQLTATISLISGQDTLVDVGTGYGKTLCMIIPCLLDSPGSIYIVISPLKRLQALNRMLLSP